MHICISAVGLGLNNTNIDFKYFPCLCGSQASEQSKVAPDGGTGVEDQGRAKKAVVEVGGESHNQGPR